MMTNQRLTTALAVAAGALLCAPPAEARITKVEITSVESPTFEGAAFGAVGAYEKLRGKAYGELDPADARNAVITDLELAPRNPTTGKVEYSMDIYLLKPLDLNKGNHKVFMEVNNRGSKLFGAFNRSGGGNNPTTAADAGDGFLMNQGYSLAWNGWDIAAAPGADRLTITVPVAKNPDGTSITGPSYEYIVFDNATTTSSPLSYPAASLDKSHATLTVRDHLMQAPNSVPASGWDYNATGTAISLASGPFKQSAIYEFTYVAKDPLVAGIGLAATRDFVSFLKYARADDFGSPNPLWRHAKQVYTFAISQPARYLNDFQTLGFNADEHGWRAIDGILNWIGAGNGVAINFRFAQTARTERNRQNHRYPEANFPFAYPRLKDSLTGKVGGRGVACAGQDDRDGRRGKHHDHDDEDGNTCPKALEVNSANEYWVKTGSLLHTDTRGRDLEDPENVRFYLLSSLEHTVSGSPANSAGSCQQFRNTNDPSPALRALFIALDEWVTRGRKPPRSEVPDHETGVFSIPVGNGIGVIPQAALGWPDIPGVTYTGLVTVRHLFDFGPRFDDGIMDINPPNFSGPVYPAFVSKVDRDGNDLAGVRLPPVEAPIATTTGWALRSAAFGGGPAGGNLDGCESSGQWIPFTTTKKERQLSGDPRKSLEERYGDHDGYVKAVAKAAQHLEKKRFLLRDDVQKYIDAAEASNLLR
ncbi:MAG: alpha/beta hydrolase domain-containing protein [Burkholderiales bacterium]